MKITAWRIVKARHLAGAFSGEGARRFGGRWNSKGIPLVYTAGSQALAVLGMLVHLDSSELLQHYRLIPITFDASMITDIDRNSLPSNWRRSSTPRTLRAIGDEWIASGRSLVLRVPSVIVPDESNYLVNVLHPDFRSLSIAGRGLSALTRG